MAYIGTTPIDVRSFGTVKFEFTATSGQTAFTGTDDNNKTLSFVDDQLEVYVNGVLMDNDDFSTSGGDTVTLASAAAANDIITVNTLKSNAPITDYVQTSGGTFTGDIKIATGAGHLRFNHDGINGAIFNNTGDFLLYTAGDQQIILHANNTQQFLINDTRAEFKGNVGIGTASPQAELHLSTASTPEIRLTDTTNSVEANFFANDSVGTIGSKSNHAFAFNTNNTERMRIDSSGNLGIGTTSPSAPLHVKEAVSNTISAATAVAKFDGSGGDGLAFGNTQSAPYTSWIQAGYLLDSYSPAFNNGYPIALNPIGGKVGIGKTSPSAKLDIYSTANMGAFATLSNAALAIGNTAGNDALYFDSNEIGSDTTLNIFSHDMTRFVTAGTERMRILTDGNVGIGTTNPSEELHIYDSGNDPYVLVDGSGGNRDSGYKINAGNGVKIMARADSSGSMFFNDNSISIIGQIGNGGNRSHIFDSEIQVGGWAGATNPARVVVARVIEAKDLSGISSWTAVGGQTDTVSGTAYVRTSSQPGGTAFFGPYGLFPPGSYTALFRLKVASNSSTSGMGFIDVSGGAVRDPVGSNPRARLYNLSPSSFGASNVYQYFALDFECHSNSGQIEFRWINWVSNITDTYIDHVLVVPRLNHN